MVTCTHIRTHTRTHMSARTYGDRRSYYNDHADKLKVTFRNISLTLWILVVLTSAIFKDSSQMYRVFFTPDVGTSIFATSSILLCVCAMHTRQPKYVVELLWKNRRLDTLHSNVYGSKRTCSLVKFSYSKHQLKIALVSRF